MCLITTAIRCFGCSDSFLAAWIGGTLALAYIDWHLQMASRNIAGVAEMAAAIHNTREAGENRR